MISSASQCIASESSSERTLRIGAYSLLMLIALLECGIAYLMVAGRPSLPNAAFSLCTLALLSATVISIRNRTRQNLYAVKGAVAAALLALFWAAGSQPHGGPSITLGQSTYELTLTLAGLLFIALLLARLLRQDSSEQACNCG